MTTTTISVSQDTKDWFDDLRPEGASSADEFLEALLAHYDESDASGMQNAPTGEDIQELLNELAATADAEGRVDSDNLAREVAQTFDYAELANKVADELEGRMR